MLKRPVVVLTLLTTFIIFTALDSFNATDEDRKPERISVAEAEGLVRAMIFKLKPKMNTKAEFQLVELTTDEIWQRMGAQIFKITKGKGVHAYEAFLIKNKQVKQLGTGFGGYGLSSMCVTDLDRNESPELVYTYSWGSGIHRSHIAIYSEDWPESITADIVYRGELILEKVDDQNVLVKTAHYDSKQKTFVADSPFGRVVLEKQDEKVKLAIKLEKNLPKEIIDAIWK